MFLIASLVIATKILIYCKIIMQDKRLYLGIIIVVLEMLCVGDRDGMDYLTGITALAAEAMYLYLRLSKVNLIRNFRENYVDIVLKNE